MQPKTVEQPAPTPQAVARIEQGPGNAAQTLALPMTRAEIAAIRSRRSELSKRIEQAVEAIAVEVERVSEGQRFVTRLMSETKDQARMLPESQRGAS